PAPVVELQTGRDRPARQLERHAVGAERAVPAGPDDPVTVLVDRARPDPAAGRLVRPVAEAGGRDQGEHPPADHPHGRLLQEPDAAHPAAGVAAPTGRSGAGTYATSARGRTKPDPSGYWCQTIPSSARPPAFGVGPPSCFRKNAVPAPRHW